MQQCPPRSSGDHVVASQIVRGHRREPGCRADDADAARGETVLINVVVHSDNRPVEDKPALSAGVPNGGEKEIL